MYFCLSLLNSEDRYEEDLKIGNWRANSIFLQKISLLDCLINEKYFQQDVFCCKMLNVF